MLIVMEGTEVFKRNPFSKPIHLTTMEGLSLFHEARGV